MENPLSALTTYLSAGAVAAGSTLSGMGGADWLLALSVLVAATRLIIDTPKAYQTIKGWIIGR